MFHSQTWQSFYEACPKLHASALPGICLVTALILLVFYCAGRYAAAAFTDTATLMCAGPIVLTVSANPSCSADDHLWYRQVVAGDLLAHH